MGLFTGLSSLLLYLTLNFVRSENWARHTILDGDGIYHLYWTPPVNKTGNNEIAFKVEVRTLGYVGMGLSTNGRMRGSDIVTGWVKDGEVYFQDRHAVANALPPLDDEQNYELMRGEENDTHTIFAFRRKLDTCDDQDMVIDDSTMRVIYAFSEEDPESEDPFYHGSNRGVKSIMLLEDKNRIQPNLDISSLLHWDIISPGVDISNHDTLYWCTIQKSPALSEKHHVVYIKPQLQEGHEEFLHHVVVYECTGGTPEEYEEYVGHEGYECYQPSMPTAFQKCEGLFFTWDIGGIDIVYPEHVGIPLLPGSGTYYRFEIHYDNPQFQQGIIDRSGFRIYYTPKLRKYDGGSIEFGSTVSPRMFIPPGQPEYIVTGHGNPEYLKVLFPETGIKMLGVLLHSHVLGREIKARHFRGNQELEPLGHDKNYDFNYQEYRHFQEEVAVLPGDQITVECNYDSSQRSQVTFGGLSTREEMCIAVFIFYPKLENATSGSFSAPTFECINAVLKTNFTDSETLQSELMRFDWEKVNISEVETFLRECEHESQNSFGYEEDGQMLISYPKDLQPYVAESTCNETCNGNGTCNTM